MADKKIKVTLVKGLAGCKASHRATVRGLGLKRLQRTRSMAWARQDAGKHQRAQDPGLRFVAVGDFVALEQHADAAAFAGAGDRMVGV